MSRNLSADPNIVTPDSGAARERSWTPPPDPNPVSPSPNVAFILASFLAGVDRTYIGQIGIGFLKLLTGGRAGWWWLIDLFLIRKTARHALAAKPTGNPVEHVLQENSLF